MLKYYLKLIRIENLIIMGLIQWLIYYFIIIPIRNNYGVMPNMSMCDLIILILSTMSIAAAGNVINDYFDMRIDRINKPDKIILGKYIKRRKAIVLNAILNGIGVILGCYLAYKMQVFIMAFVFLGITFLLMFYSSTFKKRYLSGNLMIAVMAAMVPLIITYLEISKNETAGDIAIIYLSIIYALFAFLITFLREIIKDIEDIRGDQQCGCNTMPVKLGINKSVKIVVYFHVFTMVMICLLLAQIFKFNYSFLFLYVILLVLLPMSFVLLMLNRAKSKNNFHLISLLYKGIMLLGILSIILLSYSIL